MPRPRHGRYASVALVWLWTLSAYSSSHHAAVQQLSCQPSGRVPPRPPTLPPLLHLVSATAVDLPCAAVHISAFLSRVRVAHAAQVAQLMRPATVWVALIAVCQARCLDESASLDKHKFTSPLLHAVATCCSSVGPTRIVRWSRPHFGSQLERSRPLLLALEQPQ